MSYTTGGLLTSNMINVRNRKNEIGFYGKHFCCSFQINKVPSGGRTVFPRIGVGVKPIAGSAIFWYNLHDTGEPDRLTLHGACPVLYGTKWGKNIENIGLQK